MKLVILFVKSIIQSQTNNKKLTTIKKEKAKNFFMFFMSSRNNRIISYKYRFRQKEQKKSSLKIYNICFPYKDLSNISLFTVNSTKRTKIK